MYEVSTREMKLTHHSLTKKQPMPQEQFMVVATPIFASCDT